MVRLKKENFAIWSGSVLKKWLLSLIVIVATLSFLLFLTGFILGSKDVLYPKPSLVPQLEIEDKQVEQKQDGKLHIVGLGDSLTRGVGDSEGLGYVGRFANLLKDDWNQEVSLANLAISGAKALNLIKQLDNAGVQYAVAQAEVIVFTIGGNDLNPGWDKLGEIDLTQYQGEIESFTRNIRSILDQLRSFNQTAQIYWLGLYNPFEEIEELKGSSENILYWNAAVNMLALEYENLFVIPTFDLFQTKTKMLLSRDYFHPNDDGYQLMAERLLQKASLQLGLMKKVGGVR